MPPPAGPLVERRMAAFSNCEARTMSTPDEDETGTTVILTLSTDLPTSAKVLFPQRLLTLTRSNNTVTVGRASKVSTKGFIAAMNNAWFDSPVMSRQHAQFVADMDNRKLEVSDLGSLHGTFLNDKERIPGNEGREVKNGDTLRLGAPIWRGTEQFVPTTVRIGIQFVDGSCSSTFKVPEGSDDDDDDDASEGSQYGGADDSFEGSNTRGPPGAKRPWVIKPAPITPPIVDLTGPCLGGRQPCQVIDLSSPCDSPIHIIDDDDEEEEPTNMLVTDEPNEPDDADNADDVGTATVAQTTHTEIGDSIVAHPVSGATHHIYDPRLGDYDGDDMEDLDDELDGLSAEANGGSDSAADLDEFGSLDGYDSYFDDESESDYSDEQSDDHAENPDDVGIDADIGDAEDMEESEADYVAEDDILGIEASDDGTRDPWDELPPSAQDFEYPEVEPLVASLSAPAATSQSVKHVEPAHPINAANHLEPVRMEAIARVAPNCSIEQLLNRDKPQTPAPGAVQESPQVNPQSSVATFCAPPAPNLRRAGGLMAPPPSVPAPTTATATAQVLGAKTGKTDFFLAREQNKMTVNAQKMGHHWPTLSVHALCNTDEGVDEPGNYNFGPAAVANPVAPAASLPRLYTPDCSLALFPGHDTTSDEAAETAPAAALSLVYQNDEMDVCVRRTHVGIPDLVDASEQDVGAKKTKRKAEDISTSTEEQEAWVAKAPSPDPPAADEQVPEPAEGLPEVSVKAAAEVAAVVSCDHERPRKKPRMLRVAERLGYAALGGVTAGAMIMGTLIYTAPTFS